MASSSFTSSNSRVEETIRCYLKIINERFVTVDENEPVTINHIHSYAITIKQLCSLCNQWKSHSSIQSVLKEKVSDLQSFDEIGTVFVRYVGV